MNIWTNTSTLKDYSNGLHFTKDCQSAEIALLGSKPIDLEQFPNLKGIFRAGIGKDNVPEDEARKRGIIVRYPSQPTADFIYEETANFACNLIFKMNYAKIGNIATWEKYDRQALNTKTLLVLGMGKIGKKVATKMNAFLNILTFDILEDSISDLKTLIYKSDFISIHIPMTKENISFFDNEKLSWMKKGAVIINTSRGKIIDEDALYSNILNESIYAACDVFWQEPYSGKLKEFYPDRFFMTPHVASTCKEFLLGCRNDLDSLISELESK